MFWTILIGFFIGLFARWILPGEQTRGWIMTTLVGVGGAVLATFIGQNLGWYAHGDRAGFFASVGGAVVLLAAYQAIRPRVKRERDLPPGDERRSG